MLINIHGFSSNGLSSKSKILRDFYHSNIISPTLSNIPALAVDTLEQIVSCSQKIDKNIGFIGSSIGGYLSIYLADKYNLKAVLVNPAIYPYNFTDFLGLVECGYDNSKFECTLNHLEALKKYEVKTVKHPENFLVLLQKGDELLNYEEAQEKFSNSPLIIEENGNHGYENFASKIRVIDKFLRSK